MGALAALAALGCGKMVDDRACSAENCEFSRAEWDALKALGDWPPPAPKDPSNKYVDNPFAQGLGHKFFHDARFSGPSTQVDVLKRPAGYGRAPKGQPVNISCATCHDGRHGGIDPTSVPGNISIGSGWADTNALPTWNAALYKIVYWSGRADSLWAQAVSSNEGNNMNGNRLKTAWLVREKYKDEYESVFREYPLPLGDPAEVRALVETEGERAGQCKRTPSPASACPVDRGCREVTEGMATGCWPRFPLQGKPGAKAGCQPGDASEPSGDAWDCMVKEDQELVTRVLVNWAKAVAAYEFRLVSGRSPFDRFVAGEAVTEAELSARARWGARLFVGKAACVDCHNTRLFSDSEFYNVGVVQVGPGVPTEADCPAGGVCDCEEELPKKKAKNCLPWGARDGLSKLRDNGFLRGSAWSDDRMDESRKRFREVPLEQVPKGSWRTPTLRNVALTAPYMHNGSLATLEDVVRHYNQGGSPAAVGTRHARVRPLYLTPEEEAALVAFLRALTGPPPGPEGLITPPAVLP